MRARQGKALNTMRFENNLPVIAAVGMDFEGKIARGHGIEVFSGQDRKRYLHDLHRRAGRGVSGIISFGIAGGLAPHVRPGDIVVGTEVITASTRYACCSAWTASLLEALPRARRAPIFGAITPALTVLEKEALWHATGAAAVDMESRDAAEVARHYRLPFAVLRVILDPAHQAVPGSALVGAGRDGKTDIIAVLTSLARRPREIPSLVRLAGDAYKANRSLLRSRQVLGPLLSFRALNAGELALHVE